MAAPRKGMDGPPSARLRMRRPSGSGHVRRQAAPAGLGGPARGGRPCPKVPLLSLIHIFVDQSVKELRDGDIFLVGFGEELLVKRVQRTPRGWLLKSENRDFSDIVVEGPDLETFRVYGRVRWFGRVV